jgi:hypothetical protein
MAKRSWNASPTAAEAVRLFVIAASGPACSLPVMPSSPTLTKAHWRTFRWRAQKYKRPLISLESHLPHPIADILYWIL